MNELACPSCGSTEVGSNDTVACVAQGAWVIDEDGDRTFDPSGWTEVFWDSQTAEEEPCFCENCTWQGMPDQLVVPTEETSDGGE